MANEDQADRRVNFLGLKDYGTYFQIELAAKVLERYDSSSVPRAISDVLELYNAQLYAESKLFPQSYSDKQRKACQALIPELRKTIAKFFNGISDANIASTIVGVDYEYHNDLLQLLSRYKVYSRCAATTVLMALEKTHVGMGTMLANQSLVHSYDQEVLARLISDSRNAEHVIRKYLEKGTRHPAYLPPSFTSADARKLLDDYLDSDDANPNFVKLIASARAGKDAGIDAKLKLKAKRKYSDWAKDLFKDNAGIKTGCEVSISDTRTEPEVVVSREGFLMKFSYSRHWLEENLDFPTILNNFIYLFKFANHHMLLELPSYQAELGVFERFMPTGKDSYHTGAQFKLKEDCSFLQTLLYYRFLQTKAIEMESVIAWFFAEYVREQFGAEKLRFAPSTGRSSYLERSRHLFSEMESVIKQFSLYVENGELDVELFTMSSEQVRYKSVSSLLAGKYVYANDNKDIRSILHLLFSDQSPLTYISDDLRADQAAWLLIENQVTYGDFAEYQKDSVDYLIGLGVLENNGSRVWLADVNQFLIFKTIFDLDAASYYHYGSDAHTCIEEMVSRGWLVRRQSLLTDPESSYFNYYLNQVEFSSGPDLRNKYLHGSQGDADDYDRHFRTYITALKLMIAVVIKMNDDFWLRHDQDEDGAAG